MIFYALLVFIILLGIVGAICCIGSNDEDGGKKVDKKDEYNAEEFEISELKS